MCFQRVFWQHFLGQSGYPWHAAVMSKLKNIQRTVAVVAIAAPLDNSYCLTPLFQLEGLVCSILMVHLLDREDGF